MSILAISAGMITTALSKAYNKIKQVTDHEYVVFADFEPYAASGGEPAAFMIACLDGIDNAVAGYVAFQIPLDKINDIMHQREGMGETGVSAYREFHPDLVTMDINMPGIDGIDRIEALKKIISEDKNTKVIMLTTEAEKSKIVEAVSNGAKSYIVKPITDKVMAMEKIMNTLTL